MNHLITMGNIFKNIFKRSASKVSVETSNGVVHKSESSESAPFISALTFGIRSNVAALKLSAVYAAIKNIPSQKIKYSEILGIPLVDDIPTEGSNNLVTSNGIFEGIRNSIDTITEEDIDTIIGGE